MEQARGKRAVHAGQISWEKSHTPLLVDLLLRVQVQAEDEQIADKVQNADAEQNVGVLKVDLLGDWNHAKHDG